MIELSLDLKGFLMIARMFGTMSEAILTKIRIDSETGCWNWTASKNNGGYGRIRFRNKEKLAHRASYEVHRGQIPEGLNVCHRCDNPACINPDHLFVGTQAENAADMVAKGRAPIPNLRGSAHANAKLTEADIVAIRAAKGVTLRELGEQYGVNGSTISWIRTGKGWAHVSEKA